MARVKLSEYRAKTLLVPAYQGRQIRLDSLERDIAMLDDTTRYVVKVDQGVKKRGKQGLLVVDVMKVDVEEIVKRLSDKGFTRFIAEPLVLHNEDDEQYLSFERTAKGVCMTYAPHGGVDVEEQSHDMHSTYDVSEVPLPASFLTHVMTVMNAEHCSFVEINPLLVNGGTCTMLDAAVLVDSAGEVYSHWTCDDVVEARHLTEAEAAVSALNDNATAALSFRVLNRDGAIWLLLSGGGASITIADEAHNEGKASLIGNYGEYSGGPTTEETYLYTKQVLSQMFQSCASRFALVIAGGVANFTDVKKTFAGIIQALDEALDDCRQHKVKVFVRRGGPNEKEGLALMEEYLKKNDLFGSVHGSGAVLTDVVHEALEYVDA